ncbi:MAG: redoxin domain-containing protein [Anaerolineae bacterium]|nr:redoxin domain-containing protein [Anaerolineae bacterium]
MRTRLILYLTLLLVLVTGVTPALGQEPDSSYAGSPDYPAPTFPYGLDWLNVPAPLNWSDLRGKIVILDFWTYGCINCIHMIPVLERLEQKYANELVVIGVHSAKFENEGQTENIRQIVQRYELHHPVINDHQFQVWQQWRPYGVNGWPTFAAIDPRGNILAVQSGEIPYEAFVNVLDGMVTYFDSTGEIDREPLQLELEADRLATTALAFPGKVLADAAGGRLFISDSNNNRIVIADLDSHEVLEVIGSGERGLLNGELAQARFDKPQGMTLVGDTLYVADVNNHAIRAVDLQAGRVDTLAGTGVQSRVWPPAGGPALETALSSPWDVEAGESGTLYIAMAGRHQLWSLDLVAGVVEPLVGSRREGLLDGPFESAELAQPSGLHYEDGQLYFADSESSSIRVADTLNGEVRTLAGPTDNNLFIYGDVEGPAGESRLQHALGVTSDGMGGLYVADTYNSRIKHLDPQEMLLGNRYGLGGSGGYRDGDASIAAFDEPGGLSYANGKLYVADTNNHSIRIIDVADSAVSTLNFSNPERLQIAGRPTVIAGNAAAGLQLRLPQQSLTPGAGEISLDIVLPEGYKLNDLAPFSSEWSSGGEALLIEEENLQQFLHEPALPLRVPVTLQPGEDLLRGDLTIYYCEAVRDSLCFIERVTLEAPLNVAAGAGGTSILLQHEIVPPPVTSGGF